MPTWLLMFIVAGVLWLVQLLTSAYSDSSIPENKAAGFWRAVRLLLVISMVLFFLGGIVRFVKSVWNA